MKHLSLAIILQKRCLLRTVSLAASLRAKIANIKSTPVGIFFLLEIFKKCKFGAENSPFSGGLWWIIDMPSTHKFLRVRN